MKNLKHLVPEGDKEFALVKDCLAVLGHSRSFDNKLVSAMNSIINSINTVINTYAKSLQDEEATSMSIQAISTELKAHNIKHVVVSATKTKLMVRLEEFLEKDGLDPKEIQELYVLLKKHVTLGTIAKKWLHQSWA